MSGSNAGIGDAREPAVDGPEFRRKPRQPGCDLGADVLGEVPVIAHLVVHGLPGNLQGSDGRLGYDGNGIIVFGQHCELANEGSGLYGLSAHVRA